VTVATNDSNPVGTFFGDKWALYQRAIRKNVLCHGEMFGILDRLLKEQFRDRAFRFGDFGCGDASAALNVLSNKRVAHYTGVDASFDLITAADQTLASLECEKTLLCRDMANAMEELSGPYDAVLCSYSLHHLLQPQKAKFIERCYGKLNSPGFFILIDGFAKEDETRDEWLNRLEQRFYDNVPDFTADDVAQMMVHPRKWDYPETISTFRRIAGASPWRNFEVLAYRDEFLAFLLFTK
jgi:SAM-dependent methyltransferase